MFQPLISIEVTFHSLFKLLSIIYISVSIDNWGFKLFYKCTTVYLILASVLTTAKQFFGSPIQCDAGSVSDLDTDL